MTDKEFTKADLKDRIADCAISYIERAKDSHDFNEVSNRSADNFEIYIMRHRNKVDAIHKELAVFMELVRLVGNYEEWDKE